MRMMAYRLLQTLKIHSYKRSAFSTLPFYSLYIKRLESSSTTSATTAEITPSDAVYVEKNGEVTTVILNKPNVRNAVDLLTSKELAAAFRDFEDDKEAKVAVLWGNGGHFCSGADLKALADPAADISTRINAEGDGPMGPTRMALKKPVIAAIPGYCVAGGLELALWADLRVAETTSVFGVFCRRFGIPLIDGGAVRLPRLIGQSRALDLILTGRSVAADEALSMGLVNRVVPVGESREAAERLAREIANFPQACMLTDRQTCITQWRDTLSSALSKEFERGSNVLRYATEGAKKFADGKGRGGVSLTEESGDL